MNIFHVHSHFLYEMKLRYNGITEQLKKYEELGRVNNVHRTYNRPCHPTAP